MGVNPFTHQIDCLNALRYHFDEGNEYGLVVMASGLGKTIMVGLFIQRWMKKNNGRVLFLLDQADPLFQSRNEFNRVFESGAMSYGMLNGQEKTNVENGQIVFATFQSMRVQVAARTIKPHAFGLVVVDEAHHGQAVTYREVIEYFNAQRIGLTATPDREDGKDIEEIFGNPVFELRLPQAIAQRKVAKVEYYLKHDNIDFKSLNKLIELVNAGNKKITRRDLDDTIFLKERLEAIAADVRAQQQHSKKTIIFCRSIKHLNEVAQYFPHAMPYHSDIPASLRKARLAAFKTGDLNEMLVIDQFNECINVPSADFLVFLRGTGSKRIWLQQLGRGLRDSTKTVVIFDYVANVRRILQVQKLWEDVVSAAGGRGDNDMLRVSGMKVSLTQEIVDIKRILAYLEMTADEMHLEQVREFRRKHGHCFISKSTTPNTTLMNWVMGCRTRRRKDALSKWLFEELDKLGFVWDVIAYMHRVRIEELKEYKRKHGHVNVPVKSGVDNQLGQWVSTCRRNRKKDMLPQWVIKELNTLGFVWDMKRYKHTCRLNEYKAYINEHGDDLGAMRKGGHKKLCAWVSNSRRNKKMGKLPKWLIDELDDIGFAWDAIDRKDKKRLAELRVYVAMHGSCAVKGSSKEIKRLRNWVGSCKQRKKKGKLPKWLIRELEKFGIAWDEKHLRQTKQLKALKAYHKKHGECLVEKPTPKYKSLAHWVRYCRRRKRAGKLEQWLIDELNELGFTWSVNNERHRLRLAELKEFRRETGDMSVPRSTKRYSKLEQWMNGVRRSKKKGGLPVWLIAELDELGFVWDVVGQRDEEMIVQLMAYKEANGDCLVSLRDKKNAKLGRWVVNHRQSKKRGELSDKLIKQLDEIGFVWDVIEYNHRQHLAALKKFKQEYGNCNVTKKLSTNQVLIDWVYRCRSKKRRGKLPQWLVNELDALGFRW